MVKVIGPLRSHWASGSISAPRVYSSSLRNRQDRQAPPAPPPPTGGSLLFTSTTDACSAPTVNHSDQIPGTIELWIKTPSAKGYIFLSGIDHSKNGTFIDWTSGKITAEYRVNPPEYIIFIDNPVPLNVWTHLAATWEATNIRLWVAGEEHGACWPTGWGYQANSGFKIGGKRGPPYDNLEALVTRVRFSDVARYTSNFTPDLDFTPDGNTISLWRMQEGSGTTVADESGNGHTLEFPATNKPTWSDQVP